MNKLIQNIALSAIVFFPLSLISAIEAASAHHTSSHVSTVSMTGNKKTTNSAPKKGKKPVTVQKTAPEETTTPATMPTGGTPPDSMKKGDPVDPMPKPGTDGKTPTGTNQPDVPPSIPGNVPGTPAPGLPPVPGTPAPNLPK